MVQESPTKLSLSRFAAIMGISPIHFWGVQFTDADGNPTTQRVGCDNSYPQYEWQDAGAASREEIARCIARAEADIEEYLGYRLLPDWEFEEWRPFPRPHRPELINIGFRDIRGFPLSVKSRWGNVITGGVRAKTLMAAASAIVWSDVDGDGYKETGTVTVATALTDASEIQVFYPGHTGEDRWRIRPITVTFGGGNATIRFRREMCVLESILESIDVNPIVANGGVDADFLGTVDVYRVYNDPSTQVTFMWEPQVTCGCGNTSCLNCRYTVQPGCFHLREDPRLGLIVPWPGTWNAATATFSTDSWADSRTPDMVRLFYYAGLRDQRQTYPTVDLDPDWARTVAFYAAALLDRPPCGCNSEMFDRWRADLAFSSGAEELASYQLSPRDLDNPFGTRRGAVYAWRRVNRPGVGVGVGAVVA